MSYPDGDHAPQEDSSTVASRPRPPDGPSAGADRRSRHHIRDSDMGKKEFSKLQAIIGEVKYLHEKLDGISTKKKGVHKDVI